MSLREGQGNDPLNSQVGASERRDSGKHTFSVSFSSLKRRQRLTNGSFLDISISFFSFSGEELLYTRSGLSFGFPKATFGTSNLASSSRSTTGLIWGAISGLRS